MTIDLFAPDHAMSPVERKAFERQYAPKKMGGLHAAVPGTGPSGETCKSCRHLFRNRLAKTYLKCELVRQFWTGGGATDVKARDAACSKWETTE